MAAVDRVDGVAHNCALAAPVPDLPGAVRQPNRGVLQANIGYWLRPGWQQWQHLCLTAKPPSPSDPRRFRCGLKAAAFTEFVRTPTDLANSGECTQLAKALHHANGVILPLRCMSGCNLRRKRPVPGGGRPLVVGSAVPNSVEKPSVCGTTVFLLRSIPARNGWRHSWRPVSPSAMAQAIFEPERRPC